MRDERNTASHIYEKYKSNVMITIMINIITINNYNKKQNYNSNNKYHCNYKTITVVTITILITINILTITVAKLASTPAENVLFIISVLSAALSARAL